ncbi:MAG: DUF4411 family protein [archaeon]
MNNDLEKIYCFDASIFIALNRINNFFPVPDIWDELEHLFNSDRLISHIYVYEEFKPEREKPDFLAKWIKNKKKYFYGITEKQIQLTRRILEKFPDLIDYKREKNQADPWLIALAIEKNEEISLFGGNKVFYVISGEKHSSTKRIPAACREFNVTHMSFEEFAQDNGWRIGLIKI